MYHVARGSYSFDLAVVPAHTTSTWPRSPTVIQFRRLFRSPRGLITSGFDHAFPPFVECASLSFHGPEAWPAASVSDSGQDAYRFPRLSMASTGNSPVIQWPLGPRYTVLW